MDRSSSVKRKKGHLSQSPTEAPDGADGTVPGATVSDEPIAPPGTASTNRRSLRIGRRSAAPSPVVTTLEDERKVKKRQQSSKCKKKQLLNSYSLTIDELLSDKYANCNAYFRKPVDDVEIKLPDYLSIVKFPMYLSSIKEAIEAGEYEDSHNKCKKDFMLIVDAAMLFNGIDTDVFKAANELKRAFNVVLKEKQSKGSEEAAVVENEDQQERRRSKRKSDKTAAVENEDQQETKRSEKGLRRLPSLR